ncbi:MAG: bifunctional riboflavin kinase/FAD synthetase [Bacteroidetes bacterium]|nr:bifunctional riboflavin kinase/FAD synthetase [Bacteroidota bacterium]
MQVHRNSDDLNFNNAVITIGTFDGVHTGHQQVIEQLKTEAAKIKGETAIITFDPHPRKIVNSALGIKLINTTDEKIELLAKKGVDHLIVVPFTDAFSKLTAEEYVSEFLIKKFHPHTIIIGYDHRFGAGRKGDYHLLEELCETFNYELREIPVHLLDTISVSSTRIREAISTGNMEVANELLGYPFFFEGIVVEGNKLGRKIGYPTANLNIGNDEKLIPGDGVYAVEIEIKDPELKIEGRTIFRGMMNIGFRPTVDGSKRMIEVNIFNFDKDIYGKIVRVHVKKFLRGEQKFSGLDALKEQLANDKRESLAYFEKRSRN